MLCSVICVHDKQIVKAVSASFIKTMLEATDVFLVGWYNRSLLCKQIVKVSCKLCCVPNLGRLGGLWHKVLYQEMTQLGPDLSAITQWAVDAWTDLLISCIHKSFKKCCINNMLYIMEDDLLWHEECKDEDKQDDDNKQVPQHFYCD